MGGPRRSFLPVGSRFPPKRQSGWGSNHEAPRYPGTYTCRYTRTCPQKPCSLQSLRAHPRGQLGPPGPLCSLALPCPSLLIAPLAKQLCAPFPLCLTCRFKFPPLNTRRLALVSPSPPPTTPRLSSHFQFFNLLIHRRHIAPPVHSLSCTASEHRHRIFSDYFHLFSYGSTGLDWIGLDWTGLATHWSTHSWK